MHRNARHRSDGNYACPYCIDSGLAQASLYKNITTLQAHVLRSSSAANGEEHDRLKAKDGWYDDDFRPQAAKNPLTVRDKKERTIALLRAHGVQVYERQQLTAPRPLPEVAGVMQGDSLPAGIPVKFANSIVKGFMGPPTARQSASLLRGCPSRDVSDDFRSELQTGIGAVRPGHSAISPSTTRGVITSKGAAHFALSKQTFANPSWASKVSPSRFLPNTERKTVMTRTIIEGRRVMTHHAWQIRVRHGVYRYLVIGTI